MRGDSCCLHGLEVRPGLGGLARQIASAPQEAHALAGLGRCALAAGHTAEAEDRLRHALAILQRFGAAEAAGVSAELDALPAAPDPALTSP